MTDHQEDDFLAFVRKQSILENKYIQQEQQDLLNLFIDEVMTSSSRVVEQWKLEFSISNPEQLTQFAKLYKEDILDGIINLRASLDAMRFESTEDASVDFFRRKSANKHEQEDEIDVYLYHTDRHDINYDPESCEQADDTLTLARQDYRALFAIKMRCDKTNYESLLSGFGEYFAMEWSPVYPAC